MTVPYPHWKNALTPGRRSVAGLSLKAGTQIVPYHAVVRVDTARIESLEADLHLVDGSVVTVSGIDAVELAMLLKPAVLEGRRLSWAKRAGACGSTTPRFQDRGVRGNPSRCSKGN